MVLAEPTLSLEERLEAGEILRFPQCPFRLPDADALAFVHAQKLQRRRTKHISYDPVRNHLTGHRFVGLAQENRLRELLAEFSREARAWLACVLPEYARLGQPDRASYRPAEEATRALRLTARNDLLHFDAFPSRPTGGQRILRLYVNINRSEDRVWVSSETFAKVLTRFGAQAGLPTPTPPGLARRLAQSLLCLFQPGLALRTPYDDFMLRLHHFLKTSNEFQDRAPRKLWRFAPGEAWILFSDGLSHAELRGRYALEHSFFVPPSALTRPDLAPATLLAAFFPSRAPSVGAA